MRALILSLALLSMPSLLSAETLYSTVDTPARRFQANETPTSFEIKKDQKLEVITRKEGWVRVRQSPGPKFGWVQEAQLTATMPANVAPTEGAPGEGMGGGMGGGLNGLTPEQLEMLRQQLQQQGMNLPMGQ